MKARKQEGLSTAVPYHTIDSKPQPNSVWHAFLNKSSQSSRRHLPKEVPTHEVVVIDEPKRIVPKRENVVVLKKANIAMIDQQLKFLKAHCASVVEEAPTTAPLLMQMKQINHQSGASLYKEEDAASRQSTLGNIRSIIQS